jgi:hypothetical protein
MYVVPPSSLESFPSGFDSPVDIFLGSMGEGKETLIIEWVLGIEGLAV